jgi:hypothetical protein
VEQAEQEQLVEELENRVERLRALYEQFFMGIERIEPLILRKEVDRRLWVLWREQIRNTGLRFRMHTVIQRYNTYQQYWQRICREIESGTYQRDLRRAAERFGDVALTAVGKRRKKMFEKGVAKKAERDAARQKGGASPEADQQPPRSDTAAGPGSVSPQGSSRPPPARPAIALPVAARRAPARRAAPEAFEPLELDMLSDFVGDGGTLQAARVPSIDVPVPARNAEPTGVSGPAAVLLDEDEPVTLPPPPMKAGPQPPAKQFPAVRAALGGTAQLPAQAARPAEAPPRAAPAPAAPAPAAPAPGAGGADDDLSATRLRQIYGQYVDAKRRCNESTASLTFDRISKDLRDTAERLRQKHAGKKIDFEIALKNGKPVLRPVIKG